MDLQQLTPSLRECAILTYWRLPRPNGRTLVCTSYRTGAGLELRVGVDGELPVLTAVVATHACALQLAEVWRQELLRAFAA